jgi:hypothetical protein
MLATASALALTVQVAGEDPASAGCIWQGSECIEEVVVTAPYDPGFDPRDYPAGGGGGGGDSARTYGVNDIFGYLLPDTHDAAYAAQDALAIPTCEALIHGNPAPVTIYSNGQLITVPGHPIYSLNTAAFDDTHRSGFEVVDGRLTLAFAAASTNKGGINETLVLYEEFHQAADYAAGFGVYSTTGLYRTPTAQEIKATIILHEVAHMTGALQHPKGDPASAFNRQILEKCFGF